MASNKSSPKGFTLIELLVVISIIGILAALALVSYGGIQERGRDSRRKTDLDALKKSLELAKQDSTGSYYYPICSNAAASCSVGDNGGSNVNTTPALSPTYIKSIPEDPKTTTGYTYSTYSDTGNTTACSTASTCIGYKLKACLENNLDSQKDSTNVCTSPLVSYTITPN